MQLCELALERPWRDASDNPFLSVSRRVTDGSPSDRPPTRAGAAPRVPPRGARGTSASRDTPKLREDRAPRRGMTALAAPDAEATFPPPGGIRAGRQDPGDRLKVPGGRDRRMGAPAAKLDGRGHPCAGPAAPRGHDEGASPIRGRPRRRRPAELWGHSPPRRHGRTPTGSARRTRRRAVTCVGVGALRNARHIPPTFPRTCTNLQSRLWLLPLRHLSTRPSGLPPTREVSELGTRTGASWRMYFSSIRNRRTEVHCTI